ncbi:MAG TPA: AAA family ATPase [Cycloclasticus sp.]|nr:AAA family ATPase [Cycloclasticus sp.]
MDKEFPWFHKLTQKLISSLQLRLLGNGDFFIPPLLVLGDLGVGKTTYTLRFSALMQVPFRAISLAGKNDNRDLAGTSRGWGTGHPSMMIQLINEHKVGNPIVLVDEVDKCGGSDHNGRALDTLLTLFEPTSSKNFFDEYLSGSCDFSRITWICTANSVKQIPTTLLSRLDVVTVDKHAFDDYPPIVQRSITTFFTENGIHSAHTPTLEAADWKWLQRYYTSPRVTKKAVYKWLAYRLLSASNDMVH